MEDRVSGLINKLQHIGIPVSDVAVSENFYKKLGFSKAMKSQFDEEGEKGTCVMMQNGEIIIELYQLPERKIKEVKERKDGHVDHITFDVDDIDIAFDALKEGAFNVLEKEPVYLPFWSKGCKYFNIVGPDGERLEFNQIL